MKMGFMFLQNREEGLKVFLPKTPSGVCALTNAVEGSLLGGERLEVQQMVRLQSFSSQCVGRFEKLASREGKIAKQGGVN